jgi:glycosyltransferase involved in cell wall biosynthesis
VTSSGQEIEEISHIPGVRVKVVDIPRSIDLGRDLTALWRLYRLFKAERFQIVHSTTPKAGLLCAIAARLARVPVRLHTFTGQPWVTMSGVGRWVAVVSDWLIGKLNTRCYADSPSQRQFLIDRKLVHPAKLGVLGFGSLAGIDVERFDPAKYSSADRLHVRRALGIGCNSKMILFVGRISPDKGVRELLAAFEKVRVLDGKVHLVLLGPVDAGSGAVDAIGLKELQIVEQVHVLGYTDEPERYMAAADLLCLPSYREGFGTVVIEAAAMGLPAIGTNIYGLSDAIDDGVTGALVPVRDVEALAAAISTLVWDDAALEKMRAAARARAVRDFSSAMVSSLLLAEYSELLRQHERCP